MKLVCAAVILALAAGAASADDRDLIQRAPAYRPAAQQPPSAAPPAAGRLPASPTPARIEPQEAVPPPPPGDPGQAEPRVPADDLSAAEHQARLEANLAQARLHLVLARKALKEGDFKLAARRALQARVFLRQLPPEVDTIEYDLQAEGILARAANEHVNVEKLERDATAEAPLESEDAQLDERVQAAARIARRYQGPPRANFDPQVDPRILRERTLRAMRDDEHAYHPAPRLFDVDAAFVESEELLPYQGALETAYKLDELRALTNAAESRLIPEREYAYPPDWPERVARRQRYAGGQLARTPTFTDKDGRAWSIAIYDIHDLIYQPPDFAIGYPSTFAGNPLRDALDRQAMRDVLRGGWYNPAEIIPLMRYFGGVNPWIDRGPKYSPQRQDQVVNLIRAFTGLEAEAVDGLLVVPEPEDLPPGARPQSGA
ncbi:MAG: hypothetical protein AB1716_23900, partial [Planctomycetota bacterium]